MIKLYDKTLEDLIELEDELHNARQEGIPGALKDLIGVQEALFEKLQDNPNDNQAANIDVFKRKLILNLVRYGAYLKTENRKDYQAEKAALKVATKYDASNQAAFYRLGVLAYQSKRFAEAVGYFQHALKPAQLSEGYRFKLTPQQEYNALLYIKNSALSTAQAAQTSLSQVIGDMARSELEQADISILSEWIDIGNAYLANHEYVFVSAEVKRFHSATDYQEMIANVACDTLLLDFTGKDIELRFNGSVTDVHLSAIEAELLQELMLSSSESRPLRSGQLQEPIFTSTYRQRITRLRSLIGKLELSLPAIKNKTIRIGAGRATAYFYNQTLPFKIIYLESEMY